MLALVLVVLLGCQLDDPMQQVEYLRLSYKANKDAFAHGSFRFEYTRGLSSSLADAESEIFSKAVNEEGLFVFDGANARYDLITDPTDLLAATTRTDKRKGSSFIMSFRMLTDGKVTLRDSIDLNQKGTSLVHSPVILPGTTEFYKDGSFEFPLYIGDHSPRDYDLFSDLTAIRNGKASLVELDRDSRLDGLKVCRLTFSWKEGRRTYWIDLNRGSVPLRILDHYNPNNLDVTFVFSDLAQVPNAGWLPRRRLHIIGPGSLVDRIVVTKIDIQSIPRPAEFQLDFPEAIALHDRARQLVYSRRKTWSLLNLPGQSSPGTRRAIPRTYIPPAELPGEVEPGPPWIIIVSSAAIVFLILGSIVIVRRRKRRLQGE